MDSRNKNALVTLLVGLAFNVGLGVAKLVAGLMSGSMSVTSDAFNNLSDSAVSVVTALAVALGSRAADHDHPYGHGRYEYIATFVLGAVIAVVGVEVLINGVQRVITPVAINFDLLVWITLAVSIGVKAFMAVFYMVRGRRLGSDTIKAASVDSISDVTVTSIVLVCAVIQKYTGAQIDGYISIAVAAFIIVLAVRILKGVVDRMLGSRPDPELFDKIKAILAAAPDVISSHDLMINDYGAENKIAEVDVVFPAEMSFVAVHTACDAIEREVKAATGVHLCVHADPLITDDARLVDLRERIERAIEKFGASSHDLGIDDCGKKVELDVMLPGDDAPVDEIKSIIEAEVRAVLDYGVNVNIDYI